MALVATDSRHYSDIADAIRAKNGKATTYRPAEMASAIRAITGGSEYPSYVIPAGYNSLVNFCRENYYKGDYTNIMIMEWHNENDVVIACVFLTENFEMLSFNPYTTEFTAIGWYSCFYTQSKNTWTTIDYRTQASKGGNYANNIKFATCNIECGEQTLWPMSVMEEIKTKSVDYNDSANKITLTMATGYVETLTFAFDASGNPVSYTDSSGHVTKLEGVTLSV